MATYSGNNRPRGGSAGYSRSSSHDNEIGLDDIIELEDDDGGFEEEATQVFQTSMAYDDDDDGGFEEEATQVFQAPPQAAPSRPRGRSSTLSNTPAAPARHTGGAARPARPQPQMPPARVSAPAPAFDPDDYDSESTVIIDSAQAPGAQRLAPRSQAIPVPTPAANEGSNRPLIILSSILGLALIGVVLFLFLGGDKSGSAGTLALRSAPSGAAIYVDGEPWIPPGLGTAATTPTTLGGLEARRQHRIELRLDGYESNEFIVSLEPRQVESREIALDPLPTKLEVVTQPVGANISINGQPRGVSPLTLEDLETNTLYTVTVTKDGFESRVQTIRFERGESREERIILTLVPEGGDEVAEIEPEPEPEPEPAPEPARPAAAPARPAATPPSRPTAPSRPAAAPPARQPSTPTSVAVAPPASPQPSRPARDPRDLVAQRAGQQAAPPPAAPATPPAGPRPRPSDRGAAAAAGTISVSARPVAAVWINGRQVAARTPMRNHSLAPGNYEVRVYYTDQQQFSEVRQVQITSGQEARVSFRAH